MANQTITAKPVISLRNQGALDLVRFLLQRGISVRIQVSGSSMLPFFKGNETVELSPVTCSSARCGDLLLHTNSLNNPLLHRLVRSRYIDRVLHIQTKGDACAVPDQFIPANQVLARVRSVIVPDCKAGKEKTIHLDTAAMRCKGYLIARFGLAVYYLRRISAMSRGIINANHVNP